MGSNRKASHDGQKKKVKGSLVAKGFQEQFKPQSDAPTILRDSLKTVLTLAANEKHHIASVDITGAFLQGEQLDREVFVKPPPDIVKDRPGYIWKLKKCLYGLSDASRNFYCMIKQDGIFLPTDHSIKCQLSEMEDRNTRETTRKK